MGWGEITETWTFWIALAVTFVGWPVAVIIKRWRNGRR